MKSTALAACFALAIAGCAQKPEDIPPAYISPTTYSGWTCSQLRAEAVRVDNAFVRVAAQQEQARTNDTVGVILLGLPTASLSGGNVAPQIADLKGRKETLHQTQIQRNCIKG